MRPGIPLLGSCFLHHFLNLCFVYNYHWVFRSEEAHHAFFRDLPEAMKQPVVFQEDFMDKYECIACGYIYDPAVGDPDSGIPPGTPFDKLPEGWVCPLCGVGKDRFEKTE